MNEDANNFLMGAGGKSATFKKHGDECWGTIVHHEMRQQTDFDSGAVLTWDDGNPRMQLAVTLQTDEREDEDDDGLRRVYIKGQMQKVISSAILKAGEIGIKDGGQLFVRYVSDDDPRRQGMSGAKQYVAKYEPPSVMPPSESGGERVPQDEEPPVEPSDLPF